jgi:hypothetical protein
MALSKAVSEDSCCEDTGMISFDPFEDWTTAPYPQRKGHIVFLLENLEHQESWVRYQASRRLLYLLQGANTSIDTARASFGGLGPLLTFVILTPIQAASPKVPPQRTNCSG